jgi:polar amino acid transport system substrate-binding protein
MSLPLARRLATVTLAVALASGAAAAQTCSSPINPADLLGPGKLQMAINPTLPPQQFVDANGTLQGLNVELGREFARRLCLEAEFIRMDFPAMFPALAAGRFDGIDTGMFWTEERSKIMYTVPYAEQAISVSVAAGNTLPIATAGDLAGKSAGVEVNSYQERWLRQLDKDNVAKGAKPIEIRAFNTQTDVLAALRAGQVETAVLIDQTAREIERRGVIKVLVTGLGGASTTLAFRNRSVAEAVANVLNAMRADGFYDALFDKFGLSKFPPDQRFVIRGPGPG